MDLVEPRSLLFYSFDGYSLLSGARHKLPERFTDYKIDKDFNTLPVIGFENCLGFSGIGAH